MAIPVQLTRSHRFQKLLSERHLVHAHVQVALQDFLKVEAGMIRRDRDGAPRHIDDRPPLAIEPPDTISGAAMSPFRKIVESDPQDAEMVRKRPG